MRRTVLGLLGTAAAALLGSGVAHAAPVRASASASSRALVQRAAALPANASVTGAAAASMPVRVTLALNPSDPQALASYAQLVSDPSSPLYRHYLSVAQFASRFGADASQVASVRTALTQAGLSVGAVSGDGLSVSASGTAAEIEGAFGTQLEQVRLADGTSAYADVTDPTLPSRAAGAVQDVAGLDTLPAAAPQALLRARSSHAAVGGGVTTAGAGPSTCIASRAAGGYTAAEIGSAYGLDSVWASGNLGTGATIGLAELEPYRASDVAAYQSCDGTTATVSNVTVDGGSANCWQAGSNDDQSCGLEDVLDIEDVAGLVPDATINVYEAPNTGTGLLDLYRSMVTHDVPVISTSWGTCEAAAGTRAVAAENVIFQEAAIQGEAVFAAAGDDGANDCQSGARAVDDPASQPFVTGVGGTTMTNDVTGAAETVWNDAGSGGGGVSRDWAQPGYQSGFALAQSQITCSPVAGGAGSSASCREVPDVSADADPATGYDIYWNGSWGAVGGTSAAAPTWASVAALADSSSACTTAGVRVGFANALLYSLPASDFVDVVSGNNSNGGVTGYSAGAGYDMASGLGTPNGASLVPALCAAAPAVTGQTTTTTAATTRTTPATPVPTATAPVRTTTTQPGGTAATVRFIGRRRRRTERLGRRVRVVVRAHETTGLALRYSARGLPRGLRINRATGVISGRPARLGRSVSRITARDTRGDAGTLVIRWTITRG